MIEPLPDRDRLSRMLLRTLLQRAYRLPPRSDHLTPADLDLEAEDVTLTAVDGARLRGWYLPSDRGATDDGPHAAVLVMHGWGSAAEDLLPAAPAMHRDGLALLFLDARGHGRSETTDFMSMPRFAEDAEVALRWLRQRSDVDAGRVALLGHSVGAGAALLVAAEDREVAAVVSIASMAHPREMITRSFRRYRAPRPLIDASLRTMEEAIGARFDDFAPLHTIARVEAPVLVLHGLRDTTVPLDDARRLVAAADDATLRLVPQADHRNLDGFLPVLPDLVAFLHHHLQVIPAPTDGQG